MKICILFKFLSVFNDKWKSTAYLQAFQEQKPRKMLSGDSWHWKTGKKAMGKVKPEKKNLSLSIKQITVYQLDHIHYCLSSTKVLTTYFPRTVYSLELQSRDFCYRIKLHNRKTELNSREDIRLVGSVQKLPSDIIVSI